MSSVVSATDADLKVFLEYAGLPENMTGMVVAQLDEHAWTAVKEVVESRGGKHYPYIVSDQNILMSITGLNRMTGNKSPDDLLTCTAERDFGDFDRIIVEVRLDLLSVPRPACAIYESGEAGEGIIYGPNIACVMAWLRMAGLKRPRFLGGSNLDSSVPPSAILKAYGVFEAFG